MSYPRKLQILVIEDEQPPIDGYKTLFAEYREQFPHADPVYVRSYADAVTQIESSRIFHLVILDLNLPMANRQPPADGLAPGEALLKLLGQRDAYPIPVVLVVSGRLNTANLPDLRARLSRDFWYGEFVNKGFSEAEEVKKGLQKAQMYCDVGIHIRDSGPEWFPTFSPREEDLLRRCVLSQTQCLGVDLEWWGAERGPSLSRPPAEGGPTNVFMGQFLLDDGLGNSIPTFFKFEPAVNGPYACRDAGILAQKLGHVKVYHTAASTTRSLLVTQSVTNRGRPVSLNEFLRGDPVSVAAALPGIIDDVLAQLGQLGDEVEDQVPVRSVLWSYLERDKILQAWDRTDTRQMLQAGAASPMPIYDRIAANNTLIWVNRRSCIHGDLNATNVAIDQTAASRPLAYIFDAAGMQSDLAFRDLATLEVTTLLFNSHAPDQRLLPACRPYYQAVILPSDVAVPPEASPIVANTIKLLSVIRTRVEAANQGKNYALLVFNAVMMQLYGLAVQPDRNKVANPLHTSTLASWASSWLNAVGPDLLADIASSGSESAVAPGTSV